jgi:hypothetical protein
MRKKKRARRSAIVPRLLLTATLMSGAAVVPTLSGCNHSAGSSVADIGFTVANVGFDVANLGFDMSALSVADLGFDLEPND